MKSTKKDNKYKISLRFHIPTRVVVFVLGIVALLSFTIIGASIDPRLLLIGILFTLFFVSLSLIYYFLFSRKNISDDKENLIFGNVTLDFLKNYISPVVILDDDEWIVWYNKSFSAIFDINTPLYGKNIAQLTNDWITVKKIKQSNFEIFPTKFNDTDYDILSTKVKSGDQNYYIVVCSNNTEYVNLLNEFKMRDALVIYITVDNASEAAKFSQTQHLSVAAQVAVALKEWAASLNGILKEYERDKYIIITESRYLDSITEKKFDILDRIRELSGTQASIPLTVSIGASRAGDTFPEKEQTARAAVDLALQRGGDQAVLKSESSTEFFGGRSKTVQKRTKIRSRIVASELTGLMKESANILIMGHRFADHDSIGACVGIFRLAVQYCDRVNIIVNSDDTNLKAVFSKLSDIPDYEHAFIDSASAQELISSETLLVVLDVNNVNYFEAPDVYMNTPRVAIIDHHRKTDDFLVSPIVDYIEPSSSSTCELVSEMLELTLESGKLIKEEAELLLSGILLDTKQFSRNTGVRTFSAALYLRSEGASPAEAQMLFKTELSEFLRETKFENHVIVYRSVIAISVYEGEAELNDKIAASKAADRLLGVSGIQASFVLFRINNSVHISARSVGTVNVQLILEQFQGGGHFDSAGAQINNRTLEEVLIKLKDVIDQTLN
ncbi:MAG: DHH family phosphoesterase [Clostridia bacterium]|nr:DHH family phosphoesterase [Clostridia bacterium]